MELKTSKRIGFHIPDGLELAIINDLHKLATEVEANRARIENGAELDENGTRLFVKLFAGLKNMEARIEKLEAHRHDMNLDDIGLQMTGEPIYPQPDPAPSCDTCVSFEGTLVPCFTCKGHSKHAPKPAPRSEQREVWVRGELQGAADEEPGEYPAHAGVIFTDAMGELSDVMMVSPADIREDEPGVGEAAYKVAEAMSKKIKEQQEKLSDFNGLLRVLRSTVENGERGLNGRCNRFKEATKIEDAAVKLHELYNEKDEDLCKAEQTIKEQKAEMEELVRVIDCIRPFIKDGKTSAALLAASAIKKHGGE